MSESCESPSFCRKARGSPGSSSIDLLHRCIHSSWLHAAAYMVTLPEAKPRLHCTVSFQPWELKGLESRAGLGASPERFHCSEASAGIWQV